MADESTATPDHKVFDVAKPPKVEPDLKQPAIIKRARVTDPTVSEDNPSQSDVTPQATSLAPSGKLKIAPISKPEEVKPETDTPVEPTKADVEPEEEFDDDTSEGRNKLKDVTGDAQELIDKKAAERQANFNKIALAKTYYLPINQVVRRRSKHVAIAGSFLIVLLGIAWADVSLDAGLITIPGVKAPTHFFK